MTDRNCISYWLPKVEAAGLPSPRTELVPVPDYRAVLPILDGKTSPAADALCDAIGGAADRIGCPAFLRTGQTSGKHGWKDCCFLTGRAAVARPVLGLIEFSEMASMFGLPVAVFAVREYLPVRPLATLTAYGDMPLVKEYRLFVGGGRVLGWQPYWPPGAILAGLPGVALGGGADEWVAGGSAGAAAGIRKAAEHLKADPEDVVVGKDGHGRARAATFPGGGAAFRDLVAGLDAPPPEECCALARHAAIAFAGDGAWSVDLLATDRGWFLTDMAEAGHSYRRPEYVPDELLAEFAPTGAWCPP